MSRFLYDAGGMMRTAANIRSSIKIFSSQKKEIEDIVSEMPQYFSDPIQAEFSKKYDILKQDLEKIENVMQEYADLLSSAADQVARTVRGIDI